MARSILLIELGGVIVGLAILARVAGRLGFSPIPLYLLAGLAFGQGGLLPLVTSESFIEVGAEVGVLLLLFMLGLEYSAETLVGSLRAGAPAGAVDLVLNLIPGVVAGLALGWDATSTVLLAGVTYVSSSGIVAKLLADFGLMGHPETPAVLTTLVIEDLVMAAYLPVTAILLLGLGVAGGIVTLLVALLMVAVILAVAVRFGPVLSRLLFSRSDEALLLTIVGTTLLIGGVAERFHVSAAVGAFLVGIGLSGPAADRARSLLGPIRDLFGAVFFVFFGLRTDPGTIPPVLGASLLLAAAALLTKLAAGWWIAERAGAGRRGRVREGSLLVARGEFSMAIAAVGVAAGARTTLAPITATLVLSLAVVGPLLVRLAGTRAGSTSEPGAARAEPSWDNDRRSEGA